MTKKILAVVLSLILTFSVIAVPVSAADVSVLSDVTIENVFNTVLDKLVSFVLKYLNMYWPGYDGDWGQSEDYVPENFYPGEESFNTETSNTSKWKLGYAGASLLDGIEPMSGDYYLAGTLEPIVGRVPTKVLDDQRVRVYALSDNTSGIFVHAVIDGFGLSRGDVMEIRSRMADFAEKYNIISINVSVLHQHSCIDTLGMNVPLAQALLFNTGNAATGGILDDLKVQKSEAFMENLFNQTVYAMKKAVVNMKEGELSYGSADVSDYIRDKREPISFDGNMHRLRFVPTDGTRETWLLEAGIHCTMLGAGPETLTADFPYYIEKTIREEVGVNVVFIQGAELAITTDKSLVATPETTSIEDMKAYGAALAHEVIAINNDTPLDPVLNVKFNEVRLNVTNEILTLAAREDILNAVIVKNGDKNEMITEIGYMELGNNVGIFICPGEFDPLLIYGGPDSGDAAWFGGDWAYAPLKDYSTCENLLVFGLCNDHAGYVLRDNEYHSMFSENEEINMVSTTAGSTFTNAFIELLNSVNGVA